MAHLAYVLCAITSFLCFALLLRSYLKNQVKLLLWSCLCFFFLALQSIILVADRLTGTQIDLTFWRTLVGFMGSALFLCSLIWESRS